MTHEIKSSSFFVTHASMIPITSTLFLGTLSDLGHSPYATLSLLPPPLSTYPYHPPHLKLSLLDTDSSSLLQTLPQSLPFIHEHIENGVLIHCVHGLSRSVATLLAYQLWTDPLPVPPEQAVKLRLEQLQLVYPGAAPNESFLRQLAAFAERGCKAPQPFQFPGDATWREEAGWRERQEIQLCIQHSWPHAEEFFLQDGSGTECARCRKCRYVLLTKAAVGEKKVIHGVVKVLPMMWMGTSEGKTRCPHCGHKVGNGGFEGFMVTDSAVDWI